MDDALYEDHIEGAIAFIMAAEAREARLTELKAVKQKMKAVKVN